MIDQANEKLIQNEIRLQTEERKLLIETRKQSQLLTLQQQLQEVEELLRSHMCPIVYSIFKEPVIAEDGHTYEKQAITQWLQTHRCSPLTREPMGKKLFVDYKTKQVILELQEKKKKKKKKKIRGNTHILKNKNNPTTTHKNKP
eukprot:TRINITY_DN50781_c0_g1_i1.p1 TRINITY_DN50781_c0_g1~~TRINITY_DN50781_c0_g1_i1.p1  ORF type:complete len:144 (+),score=34.49 TRINITY_DN50781_c0_g1_i1:466-897(+)